MVGRQQTPRATGSALKIARIRVGVTQGEVPRRLGISPSRLSQIENGYPGTTRASRRRVWRVIRELRRRREGVS